MDQAFSVPAEGDRESVGSADAPDDVAWPIVHATVGALFEVPPRHPKAGMLVVWWHAGRVVAHQRLQPGESAVQQIPSPTADHPTRNPARSSAARLSLIIPTRDRPADLARCLRSLGQQTLQPAEIIVVDNASRTDETRLVVEELQRTNPRIRLVTEPRPGLDHARNAGIRAAHYEICAFCDDDVVLHEGWCDAMAAAFDEDHVRAVTGLVLPFELTTSAQRLFEFEWGFGRGYERIDFPPSFLSDAGGRACPVWEIGAGASMAFRRSAFLETGLFDDRLDAGAAGCSGDSEIWYRILVAGGTCRYEPAAISFHRHRPAMADLRRQIRAYMRGHVTALLIQFQRYRHWSNLRRIVGTLPGYYFWRAARALKRGSLRSDPLLGEEVIGSLQGVVYFLRHRRLEEAVLDPHPLPEPADAR